MNKDEYIIKAIDWLKGKSYASVKIRHEDYEQPKTFSSTTSEHGIQPDISFTSHAGAKSFVEIALKTEKPTDLVTKWKLLSITATMKRGKLYLLAPKGHKSFAMDILSKYNINAIIETI